MPVIRFDECPEFTAGDGCRLREFLHPDKAQLACRYSLAHAVVEPGQTTYLHSLTSSEVYYILQGQGDMRIDEEITQVGPGDTVYIPPRAQQCIANVGSEDLVFLCIVDPAWRSQDETVF